MRDAHLKLPDETDATDRQAGQVGAELQELKAALAVLESRASRYDRLLNELRSDDAPPALRIVLPLARAFRALGRTYSREPVAPPPQQIPPARPFLGSVRSTCAACVKAVFRPIGRRIRAFLLGPILPMNQKLDAVAHELEALRRQLDAAEPRVVEKAAPGVTPSPELLRSIETLLLTIAARTPRDERK